MTGWDILDEARAMLRAAVAGVPEGGWQRPTPCDLWTVTQVLQHAALDQEVWAAAPLRPELARALRPVALAIVEPLRAYGVYAQALEAGDGAAVLLSYLGRRPSWAP